MDLEENIRIAAEVYDHNIKLNDMKVDKIFIDGAKSQAAKDYWYNEFKQTISVGIYEQSKNVPIHKIPKGCPDLKYLIDGSWDQYKEYMSDCPDPSFTFEDWKDMMDKYNQVTHKIIDEISQSVFGVAGHPIEIVLSEKWYQPNIFDKTDLADIEKKSRGIVISVGPGKLCRQESHILREHAKNGGVIIGVNTGLIVMPKDVDDIVLKARSHGMSAEPFVMHNMYIKECEYKEPPFVEKPWDTKKQKRNNYKKKKRK